MHHILYPAGSTNQPLFSQLLFACHCFSIISQEMQTDVQVQKYKRNTKKYKLFEKSLTSSQNPQTSLFYIGLYLLTAQRFRIQNRFSPSRKKMVGLIYIKRIFYLYVGVLLALLSIREYNYNADKDMSHYTSWNKFYGKLLIYPSLTIL